MATSTNVYNQELLSPNSFQFGIQRLPNVNWTIQEVSLPGVTLGDSSRNYSTGKASIPGDNLEYNELSVTFVVDESLNNWREIYNWMRGLAPTKLGDDNQYTDLKKSDYNVVSDGSLIILTNSSNPNITVSFKDLYPMSISDVSLRITDPSIDPLTSTVTFRYSYMEFDVNKEINTRFVESNHL